MKTVSLFLSCAVAAAFDFIEKALSKFDDGPFFLGQFSIVSEFLFAMGSSVCSLFHWTKFLKSAS